ncbi:hypothetical protein ACFU6I_41790 [Streptomyces sp. NPDC057486]|uniref:hypothetical protein n=1 Tax=Streptomyces sp. NPDC057486 TaxID=3346145 RepID=UPI0036820329
MSAAELEQGLQLTPLAQITGRFHPDEVAHKGPRPLDTQDKVARELCEVVHDRDINHDTRRNGAVSHEKRYPGGVIDQMNDRVITPEAEGQLRELTVRQTNFEVSLTT